MKTNENKSEALNSILKEQRKAKPAKGGAAVEVKKPSKIEFLSKTCDLFEIP